MQRLHLIPRILICLAFLSAAPFGRALAGPPTPSLDLLDDDHSEHGIGALLPPGALQKPIPPAAQATKRVPVHVTKTPVQAVRRPVTTARFFPPPAGETRLRSGEVLVTLTGSMPRAEIDAILRRHRLSEAEIVPITLLRTGVRLWRSSDNRSVGTLVTELGSEAAISGAQPNYVYSLQEDSPAPGPATPPTAGALPQYALTKLNLPALAAQDTKPHTRVLVAIIDTAIDDQHPDLSGLVEARFDAVGDGKPPQTLVHGTSIAGAIAAHGQVQGVAPNVGILSARAFDRDDAGPSGSTLSILKSVDWAFATKARIINMSFAGPADPLMSHCLSAAYARGLVLVGAAGNAGHDSPPLYPAADEQVIAVTATDADDKLYEKANTGAYIAISAPGVDVLLPSPDGRYDLQNGTSVAAAFVSGVVALVLERHPSVQPAEMRRLLTATAHPLGSADQRKLFGAGLIDAGRAVAQTVAGTPTE